MSDSAITVGVDFAASPKNTASCEIHWLGDRGVVERVDLRVDDAGFLALLDGLSEGARLGLDCPLGWPLAFVAALRAHQDHQPWPRRNAGGDRTDLRWRATDLWVHDSYHRWPLSVSTDRIGVPALRAAYLLDAWEAGGGIVDRTGTTGPVIEVYPAVARQVWGMASVRSVEELEEALPLRFSHAAARTACVDVEHAFDALIAALVARAAALGRTSPPPAELRDSATAEGWIHVPTCSLRDLLTS